MRRIKAVITFVSLALCFCFPLSASAESDPTLIVSAPVSLPAVGETFNVDVSIVNNPGVASIQLMPAFDHSVVECMTANEPDSTPGTPVIEPDPQAGTDTEQSAFTDTVGHWAADDIDKAVELGLFKGYPDGTFGPDNNVSRGEFVTVLHRMAGIPAPTQTASFKDTKGIWCESAISWAFEKGYVNGRNESQFAPNEPVTRQEAMKILFLYSGAKSGMEGLFTEIYNDAFQDSGQLASWAKDPMYWALYNELISGTSADTLNPIGKATRGQLAKILVNYSEKITK